MNRFSHISAKIAIVTILLSTSYITSHAVMPGEVRWHDETNDTLRVTDILVKASETERSTGTLVTVIGRNFEGVPYGSGTLEYSPEMLTVNLDTLDCTTFVEDVMALAMTVEEGRTSWRDFIYNLEKIRYKGGKVDGYASRLHYTSEWIVDNAHRGNFYEVTSRIAPNIDYQIKTLDFMSANRDKYPALKDDKEYERLKNMEIGYRSHRFPYIKSQNVSKASLREGDIIAITTKTPGLDVSHMGLIVIAEDGKPHLLHASSKEGKVMVDPLALADYLRRNKNATGIRVFRFEQ